MKIGKPRPRPLLVRLAMVIPLSFFYLWKKLGLPRGIWARSYRSILDNWTLSMFEVVIGSRITRAYIDQPCEFKAPDPVVSRADDVDPAHALSDEELRAFYKNGWHGPFDCFGEEEIRAFGEEVLEARGRDSTIYGFPTDRDRHLEMPQMMRLMTNPGILEKCAQLLGPNLNCWRSQFFYKPPGGKPIQWHQASTYMVEDYMEPALLPPDRDALFQLTIWVAVDPATKANGCLQIIPGSQKSIRTIKFGGKTGFYEANFDLEFDEDPATLVDLEAKPGQVIIFMERAVHGSGPNTTDSSRSAFNFRVVPPDVTVYKDKTFHRAIHMGQKYELEKWGLVCVRGEDKLQQSRHVPLASLLPSGGVAN